MFQKNIDNWNCNHTPFQGAYTPTPVDTYPVNNSFEYKKGDFRELARGVNLQLTQNFHLKEFECHCGVCPTTLISFYHVQQLQKLRNSLGRSIKINSAYRCPDHNKKVGGKTGSKHLTGLATDIRVTGMTPTELYMICDKVLNFQGLGLYNTFVHADSRAGFNPARW